MSREEARLPLRHHNLFVEALPHIGGLPAESHSQIRLRHQFAHYAAQGLDVADWHQTPVDTILYQVGGSRRAIGADHRRSHPHALQNDIRKPLESRGLNHDSSASHPEFDVLPLACKHDTFLNLEVAAKAHQSRTLVPVANEHHPPVAEIGRDSCKGAHQQIKPLLVHESPYGKNQGLSFDGQMRQLIEAVWDYQRGLATVLADPSRRGSRLSNDLICPPVDDPSQRLPLPWQSRMQSRIDSLGHDEASLEADTCQDRQHVTLGDKTQDRIRSARKQQSA